MECFVNLRIGINNTIRNLENQNVELNINVEKMNNLLSIIDEILLKIKNDDYNIDVVKINDIMTFFNGYSNILLGLDKFIESISIINYLDEFEIMIPQVNEAKESIKKFSSILEMIKRKLNLNISLNKDRNSINIELINKYNNYLSLFNDNGLVSGLDISLIDEFFDYVSISGLSMDDVYKIIIEFSKFNLSIYEKDYFDRMTSVRYEISKNIRDVEMSIEEEVKSIDDNIENIDIDDDLSVDESNELDVVYYTDEENNILNKINEILDLYGNLFVNFDMLNILKSDDYGLSVRKNIYSINNFPLICYDIHNNLINNINTENKEEIFLVFKFVIDLYNQYLENINNSEILAISEEQELLIKEYLADDIILSDDDDKLIESYYTSIDYGSEISELKKIFYNNIHILYIILYKKLDELYKKYLADRMAAIELYDSGDMELDELNMDIGKDIELINNILEKLNELSNDKELDTELVDGNFINSLIYLNPEFIEEDRKTILEYGSESLSGIRQLCNSLRFKSIIDLRKRNNTKFYGDSFNEKDRHHDYRKLKSGYGRVTYLVVSVSEENRKILSKNGYFPTDDNGNIILVFGFGSKYAGENDVYDSCKKRIISNFKQIEYILSLFSEKFTDETLEEAIQLLDIGRVVTSRLVSGKEISIDIADNGNKGRK